MDQFVVQQAIYWFQTIFLYSAAATVVALGIGIIGTITFAIITEFKRYIK